MRAASPLWPYYNAACIVLQLAGIAGFLFLGCMVGLVVWDCLFG